MRNEQEAAKILAYGGQPQSSGDGVLRLDGIDRKIIAELQLDARQDNRQLATKVGLTEAPCLRRVRRLVKTGVVDRFVALVSAPALGLSFSAFIQVALAATTPQYLADFESRIADLPNVLSCYRLLGEVDYLLHIVAVDLADFDRLYMQEIVSLPAVTRTNTLVAVNVVKNTTALPVPDLKNGR